MLKDVISVIPLERYQLKLRFEDGLEGVVDVTEIITLEGVFEPLRDQDFFNQVRIDSETGVVCWPNGADLDSVVLYSRVTGQAIESVLKAL